MPLETTIDLRDPQHSTQLLFESTVTALETMAFFCCEPAPKDALWPEDALAITMGFSGHISGTVEFVAGRSFGRRLAANALGLDENDPDAVDRGDDSLRELLNVVVGMMMPRIARNPGDQFDLSLPQTRSFDPAEWDNIVASNGVCLIDAEGETLALRILETAR